MNPTVISALTGTVIAAVSLLLATRQWYLHRGDETRKQRDERETAATQAAAQREESRIERLDKQTWEYVEGLRVEMTRLAARVETLESRLQAEQAITAQLRADLAVANGTIRDITAQNQRQGVELTRLRSQITALQGKGYRGPLSDDDGGEVGR